MSEQTNETPIKLGTIYRNKDDAGEWSEFEVTAYEDNAVFELTKKDDHHHVRYTFAPVGDTQCEIEYLVWVQEGSVSERFSPTNIQAILEKLKEVIEAN